ncbi:Ig-like domain-containing protein [Aquirufa rosea]|nr:Ig-like domain-containing protein [Aquirufa rosea]
MANPPGGKKDTLAPKILESVPLNKSKNFKGKKIELIFNEYVSIRNLNQELLITPSIGTYQTKINPKGLSITIDSTLKDNTTYTFNFRNAIEDASERNVGKNIKLVFSTSNDIDSLQIKGNVKQLLNQKHPENILVALYPWNDSVSINTTKPYYFVKTDTSGNYLLENLAKGKYYMAAFHDINNNLLYNSNKEPVDFITEGYIDLNKNMEQNFAISLQNQDSLKINKSTATVKTVLYEFNRGIKSIQLENAPKTNLYYQLEDNKNIRFYQLNQSSTDTLFIRAKLTDSLDRSYQVPLKIKFREQTRKEKVQRVELNFEVKPGLGKLLSPLDSIQIKFTKPVHQWVSNGLQFKTEEGEVLSLPDEAFQWNQFQNNLVIKNLYLPSRTKFELYINKNTFIGVETDSSNVYTQKLEWQDTENYGSIDGKVISAKSNSHFIVELLKADNFEPYLTVKTQNQFEFKHVEPGLYIIRVIVDENNNGYWDIGNFKQKRKSETVHFFESKIKLKANFQISDLLINVQK